MKQKIAGWKIKSLVTVTILLGNSRAGAIHLFAASIYALSNKLVRLSLAKTYVLVEYFWKGSGAHNHLKPCSFLIGVTERDKHTSLLRN